jgi:hypothetical protein
MLTLGIDPGLSGAVAALDLAARRFVAIETPTFEIAKSGGKGKRREVDDRQLVEWIKQFSHADFVVIEKVSSMPKQGVASTFSFGVAYGVYRGAIAGLGVPWQSVVPRVWKSYFKLSDDGELSRKRATELMPWAAAAWPYKKDHNVAEAALLAYYAQKIHTPDVKAAA